MTSRDFRSVPPPKNLNQRQSYTRFEDVHANASQARARFEARINSGTQFSRRPKFGDFEDEYFEHEDDDGHHQPSKSPAKNDGNDDDEEEDPLDAFMAELNKCEQQKANKTKNKISSQQQQQPTNKPSSSDSSKSSSASMKKSMAKVKGVRQDIEEEDLEESYYKYMESNPMAGVGTFAGDSDDEGGETNANATDNQIEYDDDGNPIVTSTKKMIDPLPMVYHSQIDYQPFEKNFYQEHEEIAKLTVVECQELRRKLGIRVSGPSPPKPCSSFAHFGFDEPLMKLIRKMEFTQPTPIQAQAIPTALSGRDVIGIAKTGSGKTAAYLWPLLMHIMDQSELKPGDGPIGLILAPTRELSQQIYQEGKKFAKPYGIRVLCAYGGGSKYEQSKDLEQGADIVVATPGRMIDFIKMKATNLLRVTYLVLDEADRMFDMGFEPQVRSICNQVRPDRQTLMFSATFKKKIEKLARDVLNDPIRIVQGDGVGEANQDVQQIVHVFKHGTSQKWEWLVQNLVQFTSQGSVLIFVTKKANAQELCGNLASKTNHQPLLLHGDMNQLDRNKVITGFKRKESDVLIATDVAARGLDISHIRTVINYDLALDIDTHTHRIGRTGRAGEQGIAYTLVTEKDKEMVGHLVRNLESANQIVSDDLMNLAMQSQWFRKSRFKQGDPRRLSSIVGSGGGGSSRRPKFGLGFGKSDLNSSLSSSTTTMATQISSAPFIPSSRSIVEQIQHNPTIKQQQSSNVSGGGGDRISLMRAAYKAQFRSQFKAASDETSWNKSSSSSSSSTTTSQEQKTEGKNKKSRWG
ncbi:ATP-dependent RNA helicase ddx42 [Dermatophagoides farinae]|uniref:RNA helicase n=1 Tax=Dermatophagoides farinae TaxID=6954 RepID=A0A922LB29_DERFA|nr:ATP-dependent RNA helicase DDX42-like [Dermatophagoides farinae]KAH7639632.1 atp-dependent rna helicase ddx42-like protein [Dermatophagoides farinae]KAH9521650.1 ATP-dependent RNA helicase ddx42 [Dermatophagoides farinae]